ncbi:hypothetical protein UA3_02580 [Enterococcus faecium EnGen0263]|uniref:hypothetical protein n=1 Tax=Enterococcus faecium TaxID=1352 RepID=UPI00032DCEC9|nr:hypothetical protein [Enterococcus faecium]EOH52454.1 hypothetical protein UA3_02580 [Enterococcus faecium EnGen0263]
MAEIKVRDIEEETAKRLTKIARESGYTNREEYLRYVLTKLAYEEFQFESDVRYHLLVSEHAELTKWTVDQVIGAISTALTAGVIISKKESET